MRQNERTGVTRSKREVELAKNGEWRLYEGRHGGAANHKARSVEGGV